MKCCTPSLTPPMADILRLVCYGTHWATFTARLQPAAFKTFLRAPAATTTVGLCSKLIPPGMRLFCTASRDSRTGQLRSLVLFRIPAAIFLALPPMVGPPAKGRFSNWIPPARKAWSTASPARQMDPIRRQGWFKIQPGTFMAPPGTGARTTAEQFSNSTVAGTKPYCTALLVELTDRTPTTCFWTVPEISTERQT